MSKYFWKIKAYEDGSIGGAYAPSSGDSGMLKTKVIFDYPNSV